MPTPRLPSRSSLAANQAAQLILPGCAVPLPKPSGVASMLEATTPRDKSPHLIIEARAGTGKTTTLIEALKLLKGLPTAFNPSPQQQAIWDAVCLSKGLVGSIGFVAFNKSIAAELKTRVPAGVDAMTMHGMGFKAINRSLGQSIRLSVNQYRVQELLASFKQTDLRQMRKEKVLFVRAVEDLVNLCKMNLADAEDTEVLDKLATHYEVDLTGVRNEVFETVPQILQLCKDPQRDGAIDFDDMVWLPVALNLPMFRYDLLMVDEAQDLNRCQQALAKMAGNRIILCGDPKQAIYGFAGADSSSMTRMAKELGQCTEDTDNDGHCSNRHCPMCGDGKRGCVTLPLTVTRRCGKSIVKEANKIVKDFSAFETNPEGQVSFAFYPIQYNKKYEAYELPYEQTYMPQVQPGDMILCANNAPLVSQCFRLIKRGLRASIQGRDIGKGLINNINRMKAESIPDLITKITDWAAEEAKNEMAKRNPSESKLMALQDKADCVVSMASGMGSILEMIRKIESIFTDDQSGANEVRLSSIHKAKGLEAPRVFLLQPKGAQLPRKNAKSAWAREQEYNLLYVGITRAIEELVHVS